MKRFYISLVITLLAVNSQASESAGDIEQGRTKAAVCSACHGVDGNSVSSEWPSLAGQHASYLFDRLNAFKSGVASNPLMSPQAAGLSTSDMQDLAAYFSSLTGKPGTANSELVNAGSAIYRLGNEKQEIASCAACHGPRGRGNPLAKIPAIAGQRSAYVVAQLKAFADGTRAAGLNKMMADVSNAMKEQDMKAVASYIEGLH